MGTFYARKWKSNGDNLHEMSNPVLGKNQKISSIFFVLFLNENICRHLGTSNEYPHHMFLLKKKKKYLPVSPII